MMARLVVVVMLLMATALGACVQTFTGYLRVFDEEVVLFHTLDDCQGPGRATRGYVVSRIVTGPGRFVLGDREYNDVPTCAIATVRASNARSLPSGLHEFDRVVELDIPRVAR